MGDSIKPLTLSNKHLFLYREIIHLTLVTNYVPFLLIIDFFECIEFKLQFFDKRKGTRLVEVTILLKMSLSLQIWTWSYQSEGHRTNVQEKAWVSP